MPLAFYDGQFTDSSAVKISPADYGFARGLTLYDGIRVYGGTPFHIEDHLERFRRGAATLNISPSLEKRKIEQAIHHICTHNKFPDSIIRIYLTAGECSDVGLGFSDSRNFSSHMMVLENAFAPDHCDAPKGLERYCQGLRLKTVPFARDLPQVKTVNYARGFLEAKKLASSGWDDILYTHPDGFITEATTANFFCVINGDLYTPVRGMYPGITRKIILELGFRHGLKIVEKDIIPPELSRVTEAFTASSFAELIPIKTIDSYTLPTTMEGPVFSLLRRAYTNYIGAYCNERKQIAA